MVATLNDDATARIGKFEFTVERAEYNPATQRRWDRRAEALTAWLLAEWRREQRELAERN